ncbi:BREX-1 system adenine-specific DNA-methyltransferase PglX [Myroides marinus]|uniref:BREX-1 system adenine-specific DNA-methyltransferase PglX n=1 Tax=Myroides marinus TaxID=703342 RepID=UPI002577CAAA|nr:BREX-1 system adenine-specific DNA-methyltransferase PglX [Myroides marinus]MDM1347561.1 BREX-1 system adenine-specific DNA-methyltransferase PglX [Myroides marinus]
MNTSQLEKFAQLTRLRLLDIVKGKIEYVTSTDSTELRDYQEAIQKLKKDINKFGIQTIIDRVAYTWFNRLMALRFLDANEYQPLGLKVISPKQGYSLPEILDEAKQGNIAEELNIDTTKINDLLDGRIDSTNPQNEVFKMLLIAQCNYLNELFPFLFEKINDYTELLLPDDLTSELSITNDFVKGMSDDDCQHVEILGWLYQFYISELNAKLISSSKAYKKEELAPASQLFTPKWIVQYMVDNTLGQVWAELKPNAIGLSQLEYYIKPEENNKINRTTKSIEEVKFFEPCCGSGHILSYAFDVFYLMYEDAGTNPADIPGLIIKNNLFGIDIDSRASQIASFVLIMKARQKYRRFFKTMVKENILPNIFHYEDIEGDAKLSNATALGSLIKISQAEADAITVEEGTIFADDQQKVKKLYNLLATKYDVVVTNPPYISNSRMEAQLKKNVEKTFPTSKLDLFAAFIEQCLFLTNKEGLTGYMTPFVWMFISSYEGLRKKIIDNHLIHSLVQLEYSGFDGATVPICTFTLRNQYIENAKGSYIRLEDFKGSQKQGPKTLVAIKNPQCGWFYLKNQKEFLVINGNPISYFFNDSLCKIFSDNPDISTLTSIKKGISTGENEKFIRYFHEISLNNFSLKNIDYDKKWFPLNKGGEFRKYFGNINSVINWKNDGKELNDLKPKSVIRSRNNFFKKNISFNKISSSNFSLRLFEEGFIALDSSSYFIDFKPQFELYFLGLLNSKIFNLLLGKLVPTLNFEIGDISKFPIIYKEIDEALISENIELSKKEWDIRETTWGFNKNPLVDKSSLSISEGIEIFKRDFKKFYYSMHKNEELLNKYFIEIYGLENEINQDVHIGDITILKDELLPRKQKGSKKKSSEFEEEDTKWTPVWENLESQFRANGYEGLELPFNHEEIIKQFISYAVGCMFGRYSLDKEGLILANQGDTLQQYIERVGKQEAALQFVPDQDNVIPVLEGEWFADDIVGRFREFLVAVWGKDTLQSNIAYIEEALGKDLRKYFVKDFYNDHVKRYSNRPIYWMFSSPKGAFNALVYMHRYNQDTLNTIVTDYLDQYIEKLKVKKEHLKHLENTGTQKEQTAAKKEIINVDKMLKELEDYHREIIYPMALERININLDDGVLVNYNKFGKAIKAHKDLNSADKKKKVRSYDWINLEEIRD